jgi:hypothetical protein
MTALICCWLKAQFGLASASYCVGLQLLAISLFFGSVMVFGRRLKYIRFGRCSIGANLSFQISNGSALNGLVFEN